MYFEEFEIGTEYKLPGVTITEEKMLHFANEFDPFPLHLDDECAKAAGFKGAIAPGVMSFMAVWAEFAKIDIWGDALIAGKSTKIEWFAPVYAGDVLSGVVTTSGCIRRNAYNGMVTSTIDIYNQEGILVIRDVTETIVKTKLGAQSKK